MLRMMKVPRRRFMEFCTQLMVAAPWGLSITEQANAQQVANEVGKARRPSVIWLHFQDCTGCSETLLRTSHPDLSDLIFSIISLDYHETVMAASGHDAEKALQDAMRENAGKYICVIEGSIPERHAGVYMKIAGKPALDIARQVGDRAAAVIAIGSCASWGGIPSAGQNPTGATGVDAIVKNKNIVNIPGCPPNPYTLLGVVLQYARTGKLPELDEERRPKFAFDRVIHDHCPRRPHFDNGRSCGNTATRATGKAGVSTTWAARGRTRMRAARHGTSTKCGRVAHRDWGACVGCTEKKIAFKTPMFQVIPIYNITPPQAYPPITAPEGAMNPVATGLVGLVSGTLLGAGYVASKKFQFRPGG